MPGPNSHYAKGDDSELEALMAALPPKKEEDYDIEKQRKTMGILIAQLQPLGNFKFDVTRYYLNIWPVIHI